ncbi:MAG: protein translocase subunit SecD, partial [Clostridia bacterium]|nr:protein translocase subunit SecD [Clostridia bacterium]
MNLSRAVGAARFILLALCIVLVLTIAVFGFPNVIGLGMDGVFEKDNIRLGLDLAGGAQITYEATADKGDTTEEGMNKVENVMRMRLDNLGYTEANVYVVGSNLIRVEIPGVDDPESIAATLGQRAELKFTYDDPDTGARVTILTGKEVKDASAGMQQSSESGQNESVVQLKFNADGAKKFADATEKVSGFTSNYIDIYLDETRLSHATVKERIEGGSAIISGSMTFEQCSELAGLINGGSLEYNLDYNGEKGGINVVSASLGEKALSTSLIAGGIGLLLVVIFMIAFYRLPGIVSAFALMAYTALIGILLVLTKANLTLPGIAGIILSIGMAVDANVVVYERIKEEIRSGKSVKASIKSGFSNALSAILDSNITTLIAAAVLWYLGSGSIQGFAITLFMGVCVSLVTSLLLSKVLLNLLPDMGFTKISLYGVK